MVSPEVQRVAIGDYAAARGYDIAGWLEGIDESGSRARSAWWPRLDQAVASVEAAEFDVILVWKFSRVARHRLRWAVAIDRVEEAGGRIESATEQFDTTTSSGRLARGMLAELQAFEAERIGETWKEAHSARIRGGRPHTGKPRFGYAYDAAAKVHVPDPETGPLLADLYGRYVAGESVYTLVRWLNRHGWRTIEGRPWSDRTLRRVLDSGFASGRFMAGGNLKRGVAAQLHQGVHEPLIDDGLWQAYLDARAERRARPARSVRSQYLLSGLVRCGRCGRPMVANLTEGTPRYRCKVAKEMGPTVCVGGYVQAAIVEARVLEELEKIAGQVEAAEHLAPAMDARRASTRSEGDRLAREILRAEEALARLAVQDAERPLPPAVYRRAVDELVEQLEQLQGAAEAVARAARATEVDVVEVAAGLLEAWHEWPVEQRREQLRRVFARVVVWTGRPARVDVVPVWEE